MSTCTHARELKTEFDFETMKPQSIRTPHGEVETVSWGDGPALLALHGAMGGYDQGMLLARTVVFPRYKVVAISRPGYLGTPLQAGKSPQEQADVCASVLNAMGIGPAAVVAISGGGPAALQFALRYSERCSALVMISACSAKLDVRVPFRWQVMKLMACIPGVPGAMRKGMLKDPEKSARRSIPQEGWRQRVLNDPEVGPLFQSLNASVLTRMPERLAGTDNDIFVGRQDMNWPVEEMTVPTLVVHGTHDTAVPYEVARSFAGRVPGAELLTIEEGGHASIFTHREIVRDRVSRFLDEHAR